mgnify:CR=1 FL=1
MTLAVNLANLANYVNNAGQVGDSTVVNKLTGYVSPTTGTMTSPLIPIKLNYTRTSSWTQVQAGLVVSLLKNDNTLGFP